MTTVRITHAAGVGDWPMGATVPLEDRRAQKLLREGYAVEVSNEPPVVIHRSKKAKD